MDNKEKPKSLTISDSNKNLMQVHAYIGTHIEQASQLRISMPIVRPTVKNCVEIERRFVQCGPVLQAAEVIEMFTGELESAFAAQFKKACASNASTDGTHLKEKGLHISAHLEVANFSAFNGWIGTFIWRHNITYRNLYAESWRVD
jgi:hypothetical protein